MWLRWSRAVIQRECHVWKINGVTGASREAWHADSSTMNIYSFAFLCVCGSSAYPLRFKFDTYSILCVQVSGQLMLSVHFYNTIRYVYFTVRSQSDVFVPLSYHKLVIVCSYITSQRCACYTVTSRLNVFIALWHHNWKLTDFNAVCFPCQTVFWIEDSGWNKKKKGLKAKYFSHILFIYSLSHTVNTQI